MCRGKQKGADAKRRGGKIDGVGGRNMRDGEGELKNWIQGWKKNTKQASKHRGKSHLIEEEVLSGEKRV